MRKDHTESMRAPLLLIVLPFLLGIGSSRLIPLHATVPAILLILSLLLLLGFKNALSRATYWQVVFGVAIFSLGGMYGARIVPSFDGLQSDLPNPPREEVLLVDPVQLFAAPPYSKDQVGLGAVAGVPGLLYFTAPADSQKKPILSGFSTRLKGVKRPLFEIIEDPGFYSYLKARGVSAGIHSNLSPAVVGIANSWRAVFSVLLERGKEALSVGSSPTEPPTRIYKALVLGQRLGLEPRQKEMFKVTGTAHLFAISGLHVGLVGFFLFTVFRRIRIANWLQVSATLLILLFYVLLTGATPSAVRAFLMISFLVGAKAFHRAYRPTSALAASALFVLLIDPEQLFTLGFQLSYIVVLSILVYGAPLAKRLMEQTSPEYWLPGQTGSPYHRLRRWFFGSLSISLAAFLGSSPLIMDHFHLLPISSILLNLLLIPPATVVLIIGFLSLLAGLLGLAWISFLFNQAALPIVEAMTGIVSITSNTPIAAISLIWKNDWAGSVGTLLFLFVTFWTASRPQFRYRYLLCPVGALTTTLFLGRIAAQ